MEVQSVAKFAQDINASGLWYGDCGGGVRLFVLSVGRMVGWMV